MAIIDQSAVEVRLAVTVYVNPSDGTLLDVIKESHGAHSVRDIVRGEIESNLESVSYVIHAHAE